MERMVSLRRKGKVLKVLKATAAIVLVIGLCVFAGFWTALWAGLTGLYRCEDVQCPVIVTFVAGPLCAIGYFAVISVLYLVWRRSRRNAS